jgi:hypothetical protein
MALNSPQAPARICQKEKSVVGVTEFEALPHLDNIGQLFFWCRGSVVLQGLRVKGFGALYSERTNYDNFISTAEKTAVRFDL